ncbi:MAG: hypothetical protein ACREMO_00925 [Gemmatimonadales bacterium]
MRRPLELRLDRPRRRWPWAAVALSVAAHSLLLLWRTEGRLPDVPQAPRRVVVLSPLQAEHPRERSAPFFARRSTAGEGQLGGAAAPRSPRPGPAVRVPPVELPKAPPPDSQTAAHLPAGRIGPELGGGRLWVRPLPLPPQDLAQRLNRTNQELADSVVTATIQAFLDSIAREPGADQAAPPDWTKEIAGLKFGLDSKNIYIAGLKIPAAVLALLALPQGNQSQAFDRSGELYADLRRAAVRAATLEDFKDAIREIRARKERERELQKAQRIPPDSTDNGQSPNP